MARESADRRNARIRRANERLRRAVSCCCVFAGGKAPKRAFQSYLMHRALLETRMTAVACQAPAAIGQRPAKPQKQADGVLRLCGGRPPCIALVACGPSSLVSQAFFRLVMPAPRFCLGRWENCGCPENNGKTRRLRSPSRNPSRGRYAHGAVDMESNVLADLACPGLKTTSQAECQQAHRSTG